MNTINALKILNCYKPTDLSGPYSNRIYYHIGSICTTNGRVAAVYRLPKNASDQGWYYPNPGEFNPLLKLQEAPHPVFMSFSDLKNILSWAETRVIEAMHGFFVKANEWDRLPKKNRVGSRPPTYPPSVTLAVSRNCCEVYSDLVPGFSRTLELSAQYPCTKISLNVRTLSEIYKRLVLCAKTDTPVTLGFGHTLLYTIESLGITFYVGQTPK
jgi:hypothetical protein